MARAVRIGRIVLVASVVLVAAWLLRPTTLGGGTTYLGTHGVSMQPMFHAGDLAVVRAADGYAVGDVVAYRSATLGTTVLHRIVADADGAFTTQGDNNSWQDPDHPTEDEILGQLWVAVPHGGQALALLRSPFGISALGSAGMIVTGLLGARRGRRRPRPQLPLSTRAAARRVTPVAAAIAALAAVGGAAAFLVPTTDTVPGSTDVSLRGEYSYTGTAQPGVTYPDGRITTGDPVWRTLASAVTVSLQASMDGEELSGTTGSVRLDLSVGTSDGWSAPVGSGPAAVVTGGTATAALPVDLDAVDDLVHRHYAEIGASGGDAVLTVTPVGEVSGLADGRPFTVSAPAPVTFHLDASALRPADAASLTPSTPVQLVTARTAPRTLHLLGSDLPVSLLRALACFVAAGALTTAAVAWSIGWTGARGSNDDVLLRDPKRVLTVTALPEADAVVELPDAAALHRVAQRVDGFVLHHEAPDGSTFLVQDGSTTYRFRPVRPAAPLPVDRGRPTSHRRSAPSLLRLATRVALR
jgi:signal peptidase I